MAIEMFFNVESRVEEGELDVFDIREGTSNLVLVGVQGDRVKSVYVDIRFSEKIKNLLKSALANGRLLRVKYVNIKSRGLIKSAELGIEVSKFVELVKEKKITCEGLNAVMHGVVKVENIQYPIILLSTNNPGFEFTIPLRTRAASLFERGLLYNPEAREKAWEAIVVITVPTQKAITERITSITEEALIEKSGRLIFHVYAILPIKEVEDQSQIPRLAPETSTSEATVQEDIQLGEELAKLVRGAIEK